MKVFNRKKSSVSLSEIHLSTDFAPVLFILSLHRNKILTENRKIPITIIDHFLYSGKFNSVLGPEGFQIFKDKLKEVIKDVNNEDYGTNFINLDEMYEVLLDSGVYYNSISLPDELKELEYDDRWLTAYRYIAFNFPNICYKDFRTIVNRFEESRGYAFYVEENDSQFLKSLCDNSSLFKEVVDIKAVLLQCKQKELREICDKFEIQSARSLVETVDRLFEAVGDALLGEIPHDKKSRKSLVIRDQELANGNDLIHLDKYLRKIAKVVRAQFVDFLIDRRQIKVINKVE